MIKLSQIHFLTKAEINPLVQKKSMLHYIFNSNILFPY